MTISLHTMLVLAVCLVVTACIDGRNPPGQGTGTEQATLARVPPPSRKPKPPMRKDTEPVNPATVEPESPAVTSEPELEPASKEPAPADPGMLVGLDTDQTVHLLGRPVTTGDMPPARYWQYANSHCVLRVFFFMDMTTQDFRALSFDLTSSEDVPDGKQRCFSELLAQGGAQQRSVAF